MSANVTATMDSYMRGQCDVFMHSLEVKLMAQVSNMVCNIKSEMYKEMSKTTKSMVEQLLVKPPVSHGVTEMSSDQSEGSIPCSVNLLHSTDRDSVDTDTFFDADDVPSDNDGELVLPRRHIKKIKRRERRENIHKLYSEGIFSVTSSPGFSGMLPDAFIYRCTKDSKADIIKDDLTARGIKVKSVVLKSHVDAEATSFKIAVEDFQDYENLLSGKYLPKFVKVKQFIYYGDHNSEKRSRNIRIPSYVNHPYCNSDSFRSHSTGNDTMDSVKVYPNRTNDINVSTMQFSNAHHNLYKNCIRDLSQIPNGH